MLVLNISNRVPSIVGTGERRGQRKKNPEEEEEDDESGIAQHLLRERRISHKVSAILDPTHASG